MSFPCVVQLLEWMGIRLNETKTDGTDIDLLTLGVSAP